MNSLRQNIMRIGIPLLILGGIFGLYTVLYAGRILPGVRVGVIALGGMDHREAVQTADQHLSRLRQQGIILKVDEKSEAIALEDIGVAITGEELAARAFSVGRTGAWYKKFLDRVRAPFIAFSEDADLPIDQDALREQIDTVSQIFDAPGKDIRLKIQGTQVEILTDTSIGKVIDREQALADVTASVQRLDSAPVRLVFREDAPMRDPASALEAKRQAERILSAPLVLQYEAEIFTISQSQIGQWIKSGSEGKNLVPLGDREAISKYVTTLAAQVNIAAQQSIISIVDGKVTEFKPPRSGKALEEDKTVEMIMSEIESRRTNPPSKTSIALDVRVTKPVASVVNGPQGIVELIGKATTSFRGSPNNRISNIKNGVRFLTGILIQPGEEFSTIKTLGTIDNTTGYLPELVIKENRTVPEFGGGLCQVSTTLFRAVMDAGLPITDRRNHSYRVSYYETDGLGRYIGPGLDATIYDPNPDFKFRNDTGATILVYAYVVRDTVTFELYGTHDGRTASIKGPTLLNTIPAGDPIYTETDTLPAGVTKQIETAHAGGNAIATYSVKYPDGKVNTQEFRSSYRRWPARYLVGTGGATPSSSPSPSPTATP